MTIWHPTDDGYADLSDHDAFLNGVPHNTLARMRREDPLAWCDGGQYQGYWSLTRYEDIIQFISAKKEEPEWMLAWRLEAFERWKQMEEPSLLLGCKISTMCRERS